MTEAILQALQVLAAPGQVVEVRAITDDGIASGYFDDPSLLAGSVDVLDSVPAIQGIYVTLNEVNPALLSRRANRVKQRLGKKDATTADPDILRRRWFPIDIDPTRPSGVSSTDEEHQAAIKTAERIARHLASLGWPEPVIADSGNGAHLLYRVDLPNDDHSRDLVKKSLEVLATLFDDTTSSIDTANHNAARIWKLYGTMSRKGDHTTDRPHRRSQLLSVPEPVSIVSYTLLEALARTLPETPPTGKKHNHSIDLSAWLRDHGIGIAREKPYGGGTLYVLDECPFSGAHRDGAFAIQFSNGAIHAGCQHTSCGGGAQRWKDLKEQSGKHEHAKKRSDTSPPSRSDPAIPPWLPDTRNTPGSLSPLPVIPLEEIPLRDEALEVLQHGDPKQFMLTTFFLDHEGDEIPAECLILTLAARLVANTSGLHLSISGESGKGKSTAVNALLPQLPDRFRLKGGMSNKALLYTNNLQPGSVILLDDKDLSEEMIGILKGVTTSFMEPYIYRSVSTDRKGVICTIPERCVWWVAKVEGAGDDQVFNRMLTCWIDESSEQDRKVASWILHQDELPPDNLEEDRPEVLICRAIWELLGRQLFWVIIPFASRIHFRSYANRRNIEMFENLIKAHTVLRFMQREQSIRGRYFCLTATMEDFYEALRLYGQLNGTAGGQETKLTRKEAELIGTIARNKWEEFTIPQLQKATGLSNGTLHRLIHGYDSRGSRYTGLLEKCPALSFCDRTVQSDSEYGGSSTRRRTNAYAFDQDLYQSWSHGGAAWFDDQDDSDNPSILRQTFSKTMDPADRIEKDPADSNPENIPYNNSTCTCTDQYSGGRKHTQDPGNAGSHMTPPAREPGTSIVLKDEIKKDADNHPNQNSASYHNQISSLERRSRAAGVLQCCRETSTPPSAIPYPPIMAKDYKPLEVPDHTYCRLCGNPWTHYVEKLTEERKRRPKDQWKPYQICKYCYARAKEQAQKAATILPGTCDPARMERLTSPFSKCTICEIDPAVYIDRNTGTKLCETCYNRITGSPEHGQVSG